MKCALDTRVKKNRGRRHQADRDASAEIDGKVKTFTALI